jgi:hypothetical protein
MKFRRVYVAKKKRTGDIYAIKVLKKSEMVSENFYFLTLPL